MKAKTIEYFQIIDGFEVVVRLDKQTVDPRQTEINVEAKDPDYRNLPPGDVEALFAENAAYSNPGPNGRILEDEVGEEHGAKLNNLSGHEKLLTDGNIIADYRGTEYWKKQGGQWEKTEIEALGVALPAGAVLDNDLTPDQKQEIDAQREAARIAGMPPGEKTKEKQGLIKAVLHEAAIKKQEADIEAEIAGESSVFDATAWFQERKAEIEAKYA
jgi:hypothetical protein